MALLSTQFLRDMADVEEKATETVVETPVETPVEVKEVVPLSSEIVAKVKRQVEFYFSDSNYPKDKFLLAKAKEDKDGFIPVAVLGTFNRLKVFTTDANQIQAAVGDSNGSLPSFAYPLGDPHTLF